MNFNLIFLMNHCTIRFMYSPAPTILSAMGANISNDQIGLGVNLFSDKKTLIEKYGKNKLNKELEKKSLFYNNLMKE